MGLALDGFRLLFLGRHTVQFSSFIIMAILSIVRAVAALSVAALLTGVDAHPHIHNPYAIKQKHTHGHQHVARAAPVVEHQPERRAAVPTTLITQATNMLDNLKADLQNLNSGSDGTSAVQSMVSDLANEFVLLDSIIMDILSSSTNSGSSSSSSTTSSAVTSVPRSFS